MTSTVRLTVLHTGLYGIPRSLFMPCQLTRCMRHFAHRKRFGHSKANQSVRYKRRLFLHLGNTKGEQIQIDNRTLHEKILPLYNLQRAQTSRVSLATMSTASIGERIRERVLLLSLR